LSQALHCQPKDFILDLGFQHTPHEVPFVGPQMQQALIAFSGDGILGLSEVENHRAVFNDYGIVGAHQKVFDRAHEGFGSHCEIVSASLPRRL